MCDGITEKGKVVGRERVWGLCQGLWLRYVTFEVPVRHPSKFLYSGNTEYQYTKVTKLELR